MGEADAAKHGTQLYCRETAYAQREQIEEWIRGLQAFCYFVKKGEADGDDEPPPHHAKVLGAKQADKDKAAATTV